MDVKKNISNSTIEHSGSIGIIMPYYTKTSKIFFKSLVNLVSNVFGKLYIISTNLEESYSLSHECFQLTIPENRSVFMRIYYFIKIQIFSAYQIFRLRNKVKIWIFYLGGETLLIPLIISKMVNVKIFLMLGGSLEKETGYSNDFFVKILKKYYRFSLKLCERILIYSPSLVDQWNLKEFDEKIVIFPRHYVDFLKFNRHSNYPQRDKIIGYIGNFSKLKGVHNLIEAIKIIDNDDKTIKFMFIGSGQLNEEIEKLSTIPHFRNRIILHGWVEHSTIPDYLNMLKILVLPSSTEGLPNILLESMACGTPVLATSVGSIPDMITDGENGYLIKDNLPETIAKKIEYALNDRNLERVSNSAYDYVKINFSLESAIKKFKKIW